MPITFPPLFRLALLTLAALGASAGDALAARIIYRCMRDGTLSLATAPEPGSSCSAQRVRDDPGRPPNVWGHLGPSTGNLYRLPQAGVPIYSTRPLPGALAVPKYSIDAQLASPAHAGLGGVGKPRLDAFAEAFRAAAKAHRVDDAWLRAIAHAESGFDPNAVSPKGAQGVMQLMPELAREYGVRDPFSAQQSIDAGARHLRSLLHRYQGDLTLAAAAYNAGIGAVARYGDVPPYRETQEYVRKVRALHARYRDALAGGVRASKRAAAPPRKRARKAKAAARARAR